MTDLATRQALVARFLDDPAFERDLRADPDGVARREGLDAPLARRLAAIEPHRVAAFRASRAHKDRLRQGAGHGDACGPIEAGPRQKMARAGVSK